MASASAIGSVFVSLGLDSAQFNAGLKKAQTGLDAFGKAAATGLVVATTAALAAGAALSVVGKRAIDYADSIDEASQKTGVAAEALSRLAYTAKVEGIGLDGLTTGLGRLSKTMADVASGSGGPAATAFQALGIQVTDAAGKLRGADEVFVDLADRFSRLEEGSTKSALAMQIFGKSGADLIPMLNYGADGLRRMSEESDRLGQTIGATTAATAGDFNDNLTKIGFALEGIGNKAAAAALPALKQFSGMVLSLSPEAIELGTSILGIAGGVTALGVAATAAAPGVSLLATALSGIATSVTAIAAVPGGAAFLAGAIFFGSTTAVNSGEDAFVKGMNDRWEAVKGLRDKLANLKMPTIDDLYAGFNTGADGKIDVATPKSLDIPTFTDTGAAEAAAARLESLKQSLMTEEELENDSYAKRLEQIQKFFDDKSIKQAEYNDLNERAEKDHADRMTEITQKQAEEENRIRFGLLDSTASIFGSLSTLAENMGDKGLAASKAFGVAEAVVNTAQGITKALAQGGVLGFAGAAAVAAAGAAQISTILSTQKGSASQPSVKGSGGNVPSASPSPVAPASEAPSQSVNVTLQGQSYGRDQIRDLLEQIGSALGDGMTLKVESN